MKDYPTDSIKCVQYRLIFRKQRILVHVGHKLPVCNRHYQYSYSYPFLPVLWKNPIPARTHSTKYSNFNFKTQLSIVTRAHVAASSSNIPHTKKNLFADTLQGKKIKWGKRKDQDCHCNTVQGTNACMGYPHTKPGPSHLPKKSAVPSAMVPATNTPRAIRVALLAALLLAGTVSPSIGIWLGCVRSWRSLVLLCCCCIRSSTTRKLHPSALLLLSSIYNFRFLLWTIS